MEKILDFKSDRKHYDADACIVWCFDNRFGPALEGLKRELRLFHTDVVEIAGGAMNLVHGENHESDYIMSQIEKSIRLHKSKEIILMVHRDCGAYKAAGLLAEDAKEIDILENDLKESKTKIEHYLRSKNISCPDVKLLIIDFEGIYQI